MDDGDRDDLREFVGMDSPISRFHGGYSTARVLIATGTSRAVSISPLASDTLIRTGAPTFTSSEPSGHERARRLSADSRSGSDVSTRTAASGKGVLNAFRGSRDLLAFPVTDVWLTSRVADWSGSPPGLFMGGSFVVGLLLLRSERIAFLGRWLRCAAIRR